MKRSIFTFGLCFVLFATLFLSNIILAQEGGSYDPWIDTNDDGIIDVQDLQILAVIYSTSGTPINKTALLLELAARIDSLNATLLMDYYNKTNCDNLFALMGHIHDGRYYTEGECISLFAALGHNHDGTYSPIAHTHDGMYALLIHYHDDRYYTEGECNSLFASVAHSHLGSDIQGGFPRFEDIYLGNAEENSVIYFYEGGSPTGEYFYWQDSGHRFILSDDVYITGSLEVSGSINIPTTTRYYTIPGCAWQPINHFYEFYSSATTYTTTLGTTYWYAPVNLPHGAVVTELMAWLLDNDGTDIDVTLYRQYVTSLYQMAFVSSSGSSGVYTQYPTTAISYPTVDNYNYAYYLYGRLRSGSSSHRLGQVRITYTITETLP